MFSVISNAGCPIVLMFAKDETPRTTIQNVEYDDVVMHVHAFLEKRIAAALEAGIARDRLIVDPGLGHFVSSNPEYSFDILRRLREFSDLGPVLVSPSRKSFLAGPKNLPPKDRLPATLDASELATKNGASLVRTHDVLETVRRLGV
jgi:dihydropteroate synthase